MRTFIDNRSERFYCKTYIQPYREGSQKVLEKSSWCWPKCSRCFYIGRNWKISFVLYYARCINYWIHILEMDSKRYPKRCYELLKKLDDMEMTSEIRMLLCKFGFESVWLEQCIPHRSSFTDNLKEKLKEHYTERWQMQLKNSSKLDLIPLMRYCIGSLRDNQRTRSCLI